MKNPTFIVLGYLFIILISLALPLIMPKFTVQIAFFWLMVLFALTWDILGGQMGYNSFGNVVFFGIGCYTVAVLARDTNLGFYTSMFIGMALSAFIAVAFAALVGPLILSMRGQYFAICTLGLGLAFADYFAAWEYVGAGSGIVADLYPGPVEEGKFFFYYVLFGLAAATFGTLRWLYSTQFRVALNAIRDDEDKAEAMGLHTTRYKVIAWMIAAFFLSLTGGPVGSLVGFIDPRELAFSSATFGVWMVLMPVIGGKGTLWGPVIGAAVFHLIQEVFWVYFLGWQRVALGLLIVVSVLFFPQGILGLLARRKTEEVR